MAEGLDGPPMADCIFCRIASGDIPAELVYEDDEAMAFLDINPLTIGHTLVVPKEHAVRMDDMGPEAVGRLFERVGRIVPAVAAAAGKTDSMVAVHNGPEAGQEVPHVHVHVIPRSQQDQAGPVHAMFRERPNPGEEQQMKIKEKIEKYIEEGPPTGIRRAR